MVSRWILISLFAITATASIFPEYENIRNMEKTMNGLPTNALPRGTITYVAGNTHQKYFDKSGMGFGEYKGSFLYIC